MGGGQPCKAVPSASRRCWDVVGAGPKRGRLDRGPSRDEGANWRYGGAALGRGGRMVDGSRPCRRRCRLSVLLLLAVAVAVEEGGRAESSQFRCDLLALPVFGVFRPAPLAAAKLRPACAPCSASLGGWTCRYRYPIPAKLGLSGGCTSYCGVTGSGQTPTFQKGRLSDGRRDQVSSTGARQGRRPA